MINDSKQQQKNLLKSHFLQSIISRHENLNNSIRYSKTLQNKTNNTISVFFPLMYK